MTKEVAEKIVRGITDKIECNTVDIDDWAEFWGFTREEYEEFLDMAVEAIEQEPQTFEWCTDCREYDQKKHCCHRWSKVIRSTVEEIKQPKTGHWIHLKHNKGKCSECHDVVLIAQMYGNANYCPNCGARMVEPQESEG